jgi:hypothetical protein
VNAEHSLKLNEGLREEQLIALAICSNNNSGRRMEREFGLERQQQLQICTHAEADLGCICQLACGLNMKSIEE